MFKLITYLFICLIPLGIKSQSIGPDEIFKNAIQAYDSTNYRKAEELFSELIDEGYSSKEIHYNLGNTYFQLHDYARAILHFEKAKKSPSPLAKKAERNIALAQERITDKPEKTRAGFFNWLSSFVGYTFDFWAILSVISLLFYVIARVAISIFNKSLLIKIAKVKAIVFLMLFFVFTGLASVKYYIANNSFSAIVMATATTLKTSADYSSESMRVLHSGSKVILLDEKDGWVNVRFGSSEGWLKDEDISKI